MKKYKGKVCPECHQGFVPRTYVQVYCHKVCGISHKEKEFRRKNGMWFTGYRRLKRKLGGNEGVLKYLKDKRDELNKTIRFVESGGRKLKSDKGWNWKINRTENVK